MSLQRIHVVDSHTGGEPTRVVVSGGPNLGQGSLAERVADFRDRFDTFRSTVVNEPRGNDAMVGALLCEPVDPDCVAGVIFFNNVGYLGMCGHGTIGLMVTLAHLGRIVPGTYKIETPVGVVEATLHDSNDVSICNVPSYRHAKSVPVDVEGYGKVTGDIAWGGNWFYLVNEHRQSLALSNLDSLIDFSWKIRQALNRQRITGANGGEIDHIELFGPPGTEQGDSRNFVLCPGKAYDRSPCGTGTSAKIACLIADGKIAEKQIWYQESIIGTIFQASGSIVDGQVIPTIRGTAFINAEGNLIVDPADPLALGIR
jgi:4-hydroxyproline epimerase